MYINHEYLPKIPTKVLQQCRSVLHVYVDVRMWIIIHISLIHYVCVSCSPIIPADEL